MNAKHPIQYLLEANRGIVKKYVADLSDADCLTRPAPGANHVAWQLGHLIAGEAGFFLSKIPGANPPALPSGLMEQHGKETAAVDPPKGFMKKDEYVALFDKVRDATMAALEKISEADLAKPSGWDMAPTVADMFVMIGNHDMMHAGQFTVLRRKLGKPVLF